MKLIILLILILLFVLLRPVYAENVIISCNEAGECGYDSLQALFTGDTWYPGKEVKKTVKISNESKDKKTIYIKADNHSTTGSVDKVLDLAIKKSDDSLIWSGNLHEFYNKDSLNLTTLKPNSNENFIFTVAMDKSAGNIYQNKKTSFDLLIDFKGMSTTPTQTVISKPISILGEVTDSQEPEKNINITQSFDKGEIKGEETQKKDNKKIFLLKVIGAEVFIGVIYLILKITLFKKPFK